MRKFAIGIAAIALLMSACTRIETGVVGLRVDMSKQVQGTELLPGSWNQTLIGDVLEFPVRDITGALENKQPLTSENVALADFDLTFVYSINPSSVSDLWTTKSRSFHSLTEHGDVLLMYNYMGQVVNNAAYKAVREYPALLVNDKRSEIESKIKTIVTETLHNDHMGTAVALNLVQVKSIVPPASILESAAQVVRSQNELKVKENEVKIAQKEAERMQALSQNSSNSIAYMDAQARLNISEAVKLGKVNTIVIPNDFKGIVNVK